VVLRQPKRLTATVTDYRDAHRHPLSPRLPCYDATASLAIFPAGESQEGLVERSPLLYDSKRSYYKVFPSEVRVMRAWIWAGLLVGSVALVFGVLGCTRAPDPWENVPGEPRVVVTIAPLYSFVKAVGGDRPAVICLCKDRGPHHFQYDVREAVLLQKADLFFAVGLTLDDHFADKMARASQRPELRHVRLGNLLPDDLKIKLAEPIQHGDHTHEGFDPHAWLGIDQAVNMVERVRDELVRVDAAHAEDYKQNAADYIKRLKALKEDGRARIANGKHKRIISHHDSLRYFAECFKVDMVDVIEKTPGSEPAGRHLARLVDTCLAKTGPPITAIAVEPQYPKNTSAKTLMTEVNKKGGNLVLIEIDPLETTDAALLEQLGAKWYETKMRENLDALAKGQP
jgi:ABC-type Zn uptake system ZnuABC Zn-binding protein ZnuA